MLPYASSPDSCSDDHTEPTNPIDPTGDTPSRDLSTRRARETGNTDFFSAVFLDSPRDDEEVLNTGKEYMTRPLQVKKKVSAAKSDSSPQRRSVVSVPTSPRSITSFSPGSPRATVVRTDTVTSTSSSTIHPHHSISRIFLNASPICATPRPEIPQRPIISTPSTQRKHQPVRPIRRRRIASTTSEYHLNLGSSSGLFDTHLPGPSPPNTGGSTPTRRTFVASQPRRVIRPKLPSSPLTPSSAPVKAAKLLGSTPGTVQKGSSGRSSGKKKDHFRPLPTQTLVDIERFFGEVPRRVKAPPVTRSGKTVAPIGAAGMVSVTDRNVGHGETVRHRGQDGSMWMDVEEEQEFAWLMSDPVHVISPVPRVDGDAMAVGPGDGPMDGYEVVFEEASENEREMERWGMEIFQSVLTMPRPQDCSSTTTSKRLNEPSSHTEKVKNITRTVKVYVGKAKNKKGFREINESFMDFGESRPVKRVQETTRPVIPDTIHPWSSTDSLDIVTPSRSDSSTASSPSSPLRPSTPSIPISPRPESPPRIKNRPPPLTLRPGKKNPNLPVISTTPDTSRQSRPHSGAAHTGITPITPFVRPRPAPVPDVPAVPSLLPTIQIPTLLTIPTVPAVPTIPFISRVPEFEPMDLHVSDDQYDDQDCSNDLAFPGRYGPTGRPRHQQSKAARLMGLDPLEDLTMHNVSFFEPDSPSERYSKSGFSMATKGGMKAGKGWLQKVVRPLVKA